MASKFKISASILKKVASIFEISASISKNVASKPWTPFEKTHHPQNKTDDLLCYAKNHSIFML
ncbi:hypothetical protein [Lysinibacillus sp. 54212]|uniref:hypothetical protein n=1 Tax=Lysinibacillus sp. 54212 TaxID=3119829 RepID=UPI002FC9BDE8